jgi:hypothetical protein
MSVDEIMSAVEHYAADKATKRQVTMLQRYFIKEYCTWMTLRAIAELTGLKNHNTVFHSLRVVEYTPCLYSMIEPIKKIIKKKSSQYVSVKEQRQKS